MAHQFLELCFRGVPPAPVGGVEPGDEIAGNVVEELAEFSVPPVELPAGASVLISSNELEGGLLPQDTTVWLRHTAGHVAPRTTALDRSTWIRTGNRRPGADERSGDEVHP